MKIRHFLILPIIVVVFLVFRQTDVCAQHDYKSTLTKYYSVTDKKLKIQLGLELLEISIDSATKESMPIVNEIVQIASQINDYKSMADAKIYASIFARYQRELPMALDYLNKAEQLYIQQNNKPNIAEVYRSKGEVYRAMGQYDLSLKWLKKAEKLFDLNKNYHGLAKTYNRFAAVYFERNTSLDPRYIDSVVYYSDLSISYGEMNNDIQLIVSTYNILGALYLNIGNYELSEKNLMLAKQIAYSSQAYSDLPVIYYNLAKLSYKCNRIDESIKYADTANIKAQIHSQPQFSYLSLLMLNSLYKSKNDYKSALQYLDEAHQIYQKLVATEMDCLRFQLEEKNTKDKALVAQAKEGDLASYKNTVLVIMVISVFFISFLLVYLFAQQKNANVNLAETIELYHKQTEALQSANATKDKFFSIIAHDLRSPLGSLMGLTRVMYEQMDHFSRFELKENAQMVFESVTNIYKLVQNLLDWSRIQRGVLKFTPALLDLNEIINTAIQLNKGNSDSKDICVLYTNQEFDPVIADSNILTTILRNLLSNSIKFTPRGGDIKIDLKKLDDGNFEFSVQDNGVGISENRIDKLFKIEEKVSTVGTEGEPSTGLGLPLCKELVTLHGGEISVSSKENCGACFTFTIPAVYE